MSKFSKFNDVNNEHWPNIFCITVTEDVFKWLTSKLVIDFKPLNIFVINWTFDVSKLSIFNSFNEVQYRNKLPIYLTLLVSNIDKSKDNKLRQPLNIPAIFSKDFVVVFPNFIEVKDSHS